MAHIKQVNLDSGSYLIEPTLYAAATVSSDGKTYTASFNTNFELVNGVCVQIKCPNKTNTAPTTFNTKNIYYNGEAIASNTLKANHTYALVYDGIQWQLVGDIDTNTTYTNGTGLNLNNGEFSVKYGNEAGTAVQGNDPRLSDARTPTSHSHGNITNDGKVGNGNTLLKTVEGTVQAGPTLGTDTTKFLNNKGEWAVPAYTTNTDEKVKQNSNTENKEFSILLKTTNNATSETGEVKFGAATDKLVTINPSTGRITAPGGLAGDASSVNGHTVLTDVPANAVFTDTKSFTITANATDGYWDLTGTNGTNAVTYALAPYSSKQSGANFYTGTTNPDGTTRLNYNGYLYATKLYSGGTEVSVSGHTHSYAGSSSAGGAATTAITTANTTDEIYILGVKSGATTTLLHDTKITATGGKLMLTGGGLEIKGHIAGDGGTAGHGLYSGGVYHNAYNNIILHGDATTGSSGIAFVSDRVAADGTVTNINQPSDRAFIQYHAYGVTTATAEGTAPTLATSGEAGRLVIGIGNDASGDKIVLQAPGDTDIIHQKGATGYPIPHTTNTNGSVGGTTTPVYVDAGVIKAGTALKNLAYKDSLAAADIPNLSWNKITSDKPTTIGGYGITDAKIASGVITLGSNTITPVTSVNGHTGSSISVTAADLGLSKAMRFIGVATVAITDGSTTDPVISDYSTKTAGDVIIDKDSSHEYVWSTTGQWELLGGDSSYKVTQSAVDSGAAATNKWVSRIQQNANGVVTATMGTLDTSGTWSGNAATATKWATARTLTIGGTGKSVDGSENVSWTLAEIGAASSSHTHTLKIGYKSLSVGTSEQTWDLHDILKSSTNIDVDTSWQIYTPGVYYVAASSAFTGEKNPESANGGLAPYRYGQLIVTKAGTGGVAQFYIAHTASGTGNGLKFRTGWNNTYVDTWRSILDNGNYTNYTVTKTGSGASGTWGISITGNAGTATEFSSNATVTLTGDTTGVSSESKKSWSVATTTSAITIKGGRIASPTTAHAAADYSKMYLLISSSTMGDNRPKYSFTNEEPAVHDGYILDFHWDNSGDWRQQLALGNHGEPGMAIRGTSNSSTWSNWIPILTTANVGTGTTNGTIKMGGTEVAVKGLGARAFDSTAYLPLAGGDMTGTINGNSTAALGSTSKPFHNIVLGGTTNATMTADSTNPRITFQENTGAQPVHLIYTDYDNYRNPAGLKIIGGTSATPAWLEVEGNIYAAAFKGNADSATTASSVSRATFGDKDNGEHNCNNISSNGLWYYTSNGPSGLGNYTDDAALYSQAYNTSWVGQIAQDYRTGSLFVRSKNNNTWQSWKAIPNGIPYTMTNKNMTYDATTEKMMKIAGGAAWNSAIYSNVGYKECRVTFKAGQTSAHIMVGLNSDPTTDANWTSLDYAWYLQVDGKMDIRESNSTKSSITGHTTYAAGDEFAIEYTNGYVHYYHNGVKCRSIARAIGSLLYLDSSFYTVNGYVYAVKFEPIETSISDRYVSVYNTSDIGNSNSVTFTDLAAAGNVVGMINAATDNPEGSAKWVHALSLCWTKGTTSSWISQLAFGVNSGTGLWYRCTSGNIAGTAWKRVIDSSNIGSQSVASATSATTATNLANAPTIASGGTATVTLSANTAYTLTVGGKSVIFKTPSNANTDTLVNYTLGATTKAYLMASQNAPTSTTTARAAHGDTLVYLTATSGQLSAKSYSINDGAATPVEKVHLEWNATDQSLDFVFA